MDCDESANGTDAPPGAARGKNPKTEAKRALEEAEARRRTHENAAAPKEIGGPRGEEPTRFGDWERGGRAVDF